ncbi:hypothetical protein GUA87_07150 [Sneathiella sp. P13V-1]|uniref:ChrR family anti-sigma-E factor n=1 Tax=Sneathiella sp. P13V-1 TaxID=2697366 RepID=UPI00187B87F4|nr:ChrR family anti-sigma-E factor [Sneathiella sp. P13V-1]MBE7636618.1 hypothetical protein [Sneathiella sp. P13V-1]
MSIQHHINDDTLLAYVNNTLPETLSVVVATHLAICPDCRKSVEMMDDLAAMYVLNSDPAELSSSERHIPDMPGFKHADKSDASGTRVLERDKGVPAPLSDYLPVNLDDVPWRRLVPGVSHFPLSTKSRDGNKGALRLLKIAPGTPLPEHGHGGQELTLILSGSYIDEMGRFRKGDIADLDEDVEHRPVADTEKDCICLIATDAPLRFKGLISRMLQPMIGI